MKIVYKDKNSTEVKTLEGETVYDLVKQLPEEIQAIAKEHVPVDAPAEELGMFLTFERGATVDLVDEGTPEQQGQPIEVIEGDPVTDDQSNSAANDCGKDECGCDPAPQTSDTTEAA